MFSFSRMPFRQTVTEGKGSEKTILASTLSSDLKMKLKVEIGQCLYKSSGLLWKVLNIARRKATFSKGKVDNILKGSKAPKTFFEKILLKSGLECSAL